MTLRTTLLKQITPRINRALIGHCSTHGNIPRSVARILSRRTRLRLRLCCRCCPDRVQRRTHRKQNTSSNSPASTANSSFTLTSHDCSDCLLQTARESENFSFRWVNWSSCASCSDSDTQHEYRQSSPVTKPLLLLCPTGNRDKTAHFQPHSRPDGQI